MTTEEKKKEEEERRRMRNREHARAARQRQKDLIVSLCERVEQLSEENAELNAALSLAHRENDRLRSAAALLDRAALLSLDTAMLLPPPSISYHHTAEETSSMTEDDRMDLLGPLGAARSGGSSSGCEIDDLFMSL
jgi:bZIP transcription factor